MTDVIHRVTRKSSTPGPVDHLVVRRLVKLYPWWFEISLYSKLRVKDLLEHEPQPFVDENRRPDTDEWHLGRVRYLYERLLAGENLDPVMVDNETFGGRIYASPTLIDGHHRLAASWFAKRETIPAYYSGRVDLLEYLRGERTWRWIQRIRSME